MSLFDIFFLGFIIGLTGAVAPGPTLIATIRSAITHGWTSGPQVTAGHMIGEFFVVILIALGVPCLPSGLAQGIAVIGGIALFGFGILTIQSGRVASLDISRDSGADSSPVLYGFITSISNPYFWIWWFSVGSALVISSLLAGIPGLLAFITGHWLSDLSWFTLVSVGIHRSTFFLGERHYRMIVCGCGFLLVIFGLFFLVSGFSLSR